MLTDTEVLKYVKPSGALDSRTIVETSAEIFAGLKPTTEPIFLPSKSLWNFNSPMDRRTQDA